MTVNQEAFEAISQLITEFPELHEQSCWEATPEQTGRCGTTRCIAGWATWWKAHKMGLLSQKRQPIDSVILRAVANEMGAKYNDYEPIGRAVLGLSSSEAEDLFHDFNNIRALARVESYAKHGRDLTSEECARFE